MAAAVESVGGAKPVVETLNGCGDCSHPGGVHPGCCMMSWRKRTSGVPVTWEMVRDTDGGGAMGCRCVHTDLVERARVVCVGGVNRLCR